MNKETPLRNETFQTGGVTLIAATHAVHDTYTAFLPALLPVLIRNFSLTNTAAGLLSVFMQAPSLLQPVIGHLADRKNLKTLMILTPAVTGAAMSLLPIAPSYGFLAFFLILAGISSAALHSVGPVLGSSLSGTKLGRGMSFWMLGGELGRALGPLITVSAITYLTQARFPWLMLGGIFLSVFLLGKFNQVSTRTRDQENLIDWRSALRGMGKIMLPLSVVIFTRGMMMTTLTTFLPTYLTESGASLLMAGASLTILEVAGMAGAFLAGSLSDRFGRRRMLVISFIATPILMFIFIQVQNVLRIPLLILLGFFAISVVPVIMALVMENYPNNRSFANGVYMGLSFTLRSLAILLVGALSDWIDLRFTFLLSAGLLLVGLPFVFLLPKTVRHREPPTSTVS
jgi:FSR family fosmidomycin resistance protein-like MFS transporter